MAILKRYDVPATFFEVGRNLGKLEPDGKVDLSPLASVSRSLMEQGYTVGNHSLTHAQLSGNRRRAAQPDPRHRPHAARGRCQACAAVPLSLRRAQRRGHADPGRGRTEVGDVERGFAGLGRPGPDRAQRGILLFHDIHAAADPGPAQRRRLPVRRLERARLQRGARGQQCRRTGGDQRLRQVVGHRHRHRRLRALAQAAVRGQRCAGHRADRQLRFPVVAGCYQEARTPARCDPQAGLRARPRLHRARRLGPGAVRHRRDSDDRDPGHRRKPGSQARAVRDGRVLQRPGPDPWRRYQRLPARERAAHRPTDAHRRRRPPSWPPTNPRR
ncbi:polysaccharide deacetylase family protein [Pantoea ananatis]|uniref:polysaccharide deacetylase family protein n=1 Tax=Pantoea ananas TaxID=553 RepID=UPI0039B8AE10